MRQHKAGQQGKKTDVAAPSAVSRDDGWWSGESTDGETPWEPGRARRFRPGHAVTS